MNYNVMKGFVNSYSGPAVSGLGYLSKFSYQKTGQIPLNFTGCITDKLNGGVESESERFPGFGLGKCLADESFNNRCQLPCIDMTANSSNERAVLIARSVLSGIRNLNAQGKGVGVEEISALIESDADMADLLVPPTQLEKYQKNEILRQRKEIDTLKDNLRSSVTKRRALIVQADTADRKAAKTKEFMLRAFLVLMPYLNPGESRQLKNTLSRIRELLKQKAPIHEIDGVFQQLKDGSLLDELEVPDDPTPAGKKSSGFALFKRSPGEPKNLLGSFKDRYLKVIDDLKSFLDPTGLKEIAEIEERLRSALESYDLLDVQKELRTLLKSYVHRVGIEREEVAGFILEIGERLSEIELKILHCTTSFRETGQVSAEFTTAIEQEMTSIQDAVDITKNLEELKSRVMGSIGQIKKAIEKKRKDEWKHAQQSEEQISILSNYIDRMKLEIDSAKKRAERLESEALLDPQTKTHSRGAYERRVEMELKRYQRDGISFSLLLLNIDGFKHINERYGHNVGDICLKGLARRIKPLLADADFLARFEGDLFAVILPAALSPDARKLAEKIRVHIEKTNFLHKKEQVKVTLSAGVAEVGPGDQSAEDLFERAAKALSRAKETGRNRVELA